MKHLLTLSRYAAVLAVTAFLVWMAFGTIQVADGQDRGDFLLKTWQSAAKLPLVLMVVVSMVSHVIRAERWRLLLASAGTPARSWPTFLSVMVGYLVNLVVPRGGELSRALNLYRLDGVKPETSFGTVITERVIDVLFLISFVALAFVLESDKLGAFLSGLPVSEDFSVPWWVYLVATGVVLLIALGYRARKNSKFRSLLDGFKAGLFSVFSLDRKGLFLTHSVLIWALYFLTTWLVLQSFAQTKELGFEAVLMIFALGSIAMAIPLPGGTGSYHTIVPLGLVSFYGLAQADAVALVFIFHALQSLILLVFGLLALLITFWTKRLPGPDSH